MAAHDGNSASQEASQTSEPATGPIGEPSQPPPGLFQGLAARFAGWETIGEQRDFYDEQDCLHPSHSLASEKLQNRGMDDIVIFDYSLNPDHLACVYGNPISEEGSPSSRPFRTDDDIFFCMPMREFIGSEQFKQILSPTDEPGELSRGPRLGIIDFPQCYDTYDNSLLNSMAGELGLQREGETAFMGAYLQRIRALPGRGCFRTGISLLAPCKEPSELFKSSLLEQPKPGPSESPKLSSLEDRFILFASFPYFGASSEEIALGPECESVKLLRFKCLGVSVPSRKGKAREEERDDIKEISGKEENDHIGEVLVHQARYMIFDNYTMATFRSKEDRARDQVPLHRFQERIGAFRAMIHMIANLMRLELSTLEKLRAALCNLEEDINQMISDAKTYETNQGMREIPTDQPLQAELEPGVALTKEDKQKMKEEDERVRQNNVLKRKQRAIRDLITSLNRLSAAFFAAISVAERQIAVLQDLHSVFSTSYRTKTKPYEKEYPLRKNPFYRNIALIPILAENPEQIWRNTLDTIDEVIRERQYFIRKVRELVEHMDIRRKILSVFLKSDQAKAAPTESTARETRDLMKRTEDTSRETQAELVQQGQTLSGFTLVNTAFLPLSFCTSYFGMGTVMELSTASISRGGFWMTAGPVFAGTILLVAIVVSWKRPWAVGLRSRVWMWQSKSKAYIIGNRRGIADVENQDLPAPSL